MYRIKRICKAEYSQKPQLLIVTNYAGLDENYVDHISNLCGCKPIKKYIDDKIQKADQESGLAPTLKNVCDFYGTAGEVEADGNLFVSTNKLLPSRSTKVQNIEFDAERYWNPTEYELNHSNTKEYLLEGTAKLIRKVK